jgi:sugar phosphate isomerase/epimerase
MKIAYSTLAFPGEETGAVLEKGASWGYQGVEIRLVDGQIVGTDFAEERAKQIGRAARRLGLAVVALDTSLAVLVGDAEVTAQEMARYLQLARAFSAPLVRVFGGEVSDPAGPKSAFGRARRAFEALGDMPVDMGVAFGLETHDSLARSALLAELIEPLDPDVVGAVWDSHHPHRMGESPSEVLANLRGRIRLLQVKDALRDATDPSGWKLVALGEGEVPVQEILGLVARAGGVQWVSLEWERHWHPEIDPADLTLPRQLETLKSWLEAA